MNAIKILIFKQNNVLCIVTQKVRKNEWNVYNVCKLPKNLLSQKKKVPANLEEDVSILKWKIN